MLREDIAITCAISFIYPITLSANVACRMKNILPDVDYDSHLVEHLGDL